MEYPISLDTALTLVNGIRMMKLEDLEKAKTDAEKEKILNELKMLLKEEKLLYGSDEFSKLSVMDKVIRLYSPILKKYYTSS